MMKKYQIFLLMWCMMLALCSCTHNGGPSGNLYGRWYLERIDGKNVEVPTQNGDLYWSFQKDVILMQKDNGFHSVFQRFGLFLVEEDYLYLNFPDEEAPPFPETGLKVGENKLQIQKMTGKEMELIYHPKSDESLIYFLRKW